MIRDWYYNRLRPYVTFARAMFGIHSDFRPIGKSIPNPSGMLCVVPMANVSYSHPQDGRLVTFDVRNAKDEFVHHVQTAIPAYGNWTIGWYDDTTVLVRSSAAEPEAFAVGTSGLVHKLREPYDGDLLAAIESVPLPKTNVKPTVARCERNRTRR